MGRIDPLLGCLAHAHGWSITSLRDPLQWAFEADAQPFETIVGAPGKLYGVRLTLEPGASKEALARALGVAGHPWGAPDWIGLRAGAAGPAKIKAYHGMTRFDGRFELPEGMPPGLSPVMASKDEQAEELYMRLQPERSWRVFAAQALALIGGEVWDFEPLPRAAGSGFGLSLGWTARRLTSVTLYAQRRCFGDEQSLQRSWSRGLGETDRRAYELALAGVRSLGNRRLIGWHSALAWKFTRGFGWSRAASLPMPALES